MQDWPDDVVHLVLAKLEDDLWDDFEAACAETCVDLEPPCHQ